QGLAGIIGVFLQFATGAFIPVQNLPEPLQFISFILPHTWAYELIRVPVSFFIEEVLEFHTQKAIFMPPSEKLLTIT
ncbi:MAG TPA: ABC transporter permease, partial [Bacteroidia bacterium]|nr:ABC transporter permease [Bacteroidia bacterium]